MSDFKETETRCEGLRAYVVEEKEFRAAFLEVQRELGAVAKAGTNSHFGSKYATLEGVINEAKPILNKHGFTYSHDVGTINASNQLYIVLNVQHSGGHSESKTSCWPLARPTDPQCLASVTTYARRITLISYLGLSTTDDDGEGSVPDRTQKAQYQKKEPAAPSKGSEFNLYVTGILRDSPSKERLTALHAEVTASTAVKDEATRGRMLEKISTLISDKLTEEASK